MSAESHRQRAASEAKLVIERTAATVDFDRTVTVRLGDLLTLWGFAAYRPHTADVQEALEGAGAKVGMLGGVNYARPTWLSKPCDYPMCYGAPISPKRAYCPTHQPDEESSDRRCAVCNERFFGTSDFCRPCDEADDRLAKDG